MLSKVRCITLSLLQTEWKENISWYVGADATDGLAIVDAIPVSSAVHTWSPRIGRHGQCPWLGWLLYSKGAP